MPTVEVRGIIMRPWRPALVRWVVDGKVVTKKEALEHRVKGRAVLCAPELRGGAGPGEYSGVGGHANPSSQGDAAAAAARTPEQALEHEAGLIRLGINTREVMTELKETMWGSVHRDAPMRVVLFSTFEELGEIPRSSHKKTVPLSQVPGFKVVFISHRWLRPWHTEKECTVHGHEWAGRAHPDDAKGTKHKLICHGVRNLCKRKGWAINKVCLWVDFCGLLCTRPHFAVVAFGLVEADRQALCSGVEQDDGKKLKAGAASFRGYITVCDAILIPAPQVPEEGAKTIDLVPGEYGDRGWTRLEAMSFDVVSTLRQVETPDIWVAAGEGAAFLQRFTYVLAELPSKGVLFSEDDRRYIEEHEGNFLKEMKASVVRRGYITMHGGSVRGVAFHPKIETGLVASCGDDGTIKLVDKETGALRGELLGHEDKVNCIAFNSDGSKLVSGGSDATVRIWDVASGKELVGPLKGHSGPVTSVAFSPDGTTVVSGSWDGTLRLWGVETGSEKCSLKGHSVSVFSVAWSPDGKLVASGGSGDNTIRVWDVATGKEAMGPLKGHSSLVSSVAWSPDGKLVASGSGDPLDLGGGGDNSVRIWDVGTGLEKFCLNGYSGRVTSVAFSPDGTTVVSGSWHGVVRLWDLETGSEKCSLTGHSDWVQAVAWSPCGNFVASGSSDYTVKVWDIQTGPEKGSRHSSGWVLCMAWSPDGKTVASGGMDNTVRLWDVKTGKEKGSLKGHSGDVRSVAFSPDGKTIASGSCDTTVRLWDVETGREKFSLKGHSDTVSSVAFSPDGKTVASGSWDNTVRTWDVETGREKFSLTGHSKTGCFASCFGTLKGHSSCVLCVAWSPDGKTVASASDDGIVRLWDAETGSEKCSLKGNIASWQKDLDPHTKELAAKVKQGDSNRTGKYIVTAHDGDMLCVNVANSDGEGPLACFRSPARVSAVSCMGTSVVVGCQDGQVIFLEAPLLSA